MKDIYNNLIWIIWIIVSLATIFVFISTNNTADNCETNPQTIYYIYASLLCQYQLKGLIIFILLFTLAMLFIHIMIKSINKHK